MARDEACRLNRQHKAMWVECDAAACQPTRPGGPLPRKGTPVRSVVSPRDLFAFPPRHRNGLTTNLTVDLFRKGRDVFVDDAATAFTYKDKPVTAQQVGRELGVRFVLQGSPAQRQQDTHRIPLLEVPGQRRMLLSDSISVVAASSIR